MQLTLFKKTGLKSNILISGLEGFKADSNHDGIILAGEWFDFSYDYTIDKVSNQHPVFSGNGDMVISLFSLVPIPGTIWMLGSGLLGLVCAGWKLKKSAKS